MENGDDNGAGSDCQSATLGIDATDGGTGERGGSVSPAPQKHPCVDCSFCQWCSDDRCRLCLGGAKGRCCRKLSFQEQIELYEKVNGNEQGSGPG